MKFHSYMREVCCWGSTHNLRHRASWNSPLCKWKPSLATGKTVSHAEDPFSWASSTECWSCGFSRPSTSCVRSFSISFFRFLFCTDPLHLFVHHFLLKYLCMLLICTAKKMKFCMNYTVVLFLFSLTRQSLLWKHERSGQLSVRDLSRQNAISITPKSLL